MMQHGCVQSLRYWQSAFVEQVFLTLHSSELAHRRRLTPMHTQIVNRLHSLLHRYHFVPPAGELFWDSHRAWWEGLQC